MKITIDETKCAGCGLCRQIAPALFYINGTNAVITEAGRRLLEEDELLRARVQEILDSCPAEAITITYEK